MDDENRKAFDEIKTAMQSSKALPVNVSDTAHTLIGVVLAGKAAKGAGKAAASGDEVMSMAELTGFVITSTMGVLGTDSSKIDVGVKLRHLTPSKASGRRANSDGAMGKPGITVVGRLPAIKNAYFDVAYEQDKDEPTIKRLVSLGASFKIKTDKFTQKGVAIVKTVRPKGELADFPRFVPKATYAEKFPLSEKNVVSSKLNAEQQQANAALIQEYYAAQAGSALNAAGAVFGAEFTDTVRKAAATAATGARRDEGGVA
jgi:hypothetical protein